MRPILLIFSIAIAITSLLLLLFVPNAIEAEAFIYEVITILAVLFNWFVAILFYSFKKINKKKAVGYSLALIVFLFFHFVFQCITYNLSMALSFLTASAFLLIELVLFNKGR
jgi:hypothetical protein